MEMFYNRLSALKIVPVVAIEEAENANRLGDALCAGGLPCAEVTFRTAAAAESIKIMADRGDMLVGAGTVLTISQAKQAIDNGAQFIVSPGFSGAVVEFCQDKGVPVLPGVCTPTELCHAVEYGLNVVKFFPAESFGGLKTLKALAAAFVNFRFVPTGGIDVSNIQDYLQYKRVLACGGSWMVKTDMITAQNFDKIHELTKEAVKLVRG